MCGICKRCLRWVQRKCFRGSNTNIWKVADRVIDSSPMATSVFGVSGPLLVISLYPMYRYKKARGWNTMHQAMTNNTSNIIFPPPLGGRNPPAHGTYVCGRRDGHMVRISPHMPGILPFGFGSFCGPLLQSPCFTLCCVGVSLTLPEYRESNSVNESVHSSERLPCL